MFPPFTNFPTGVANGNAAQDYGTNAATTDVVLTVTDVAGSTSVAPAELVVLNMTGILAAPYNAQLPTAASLLSAFSGVPTSYVLRVLNTSSGAFAWTITTNTGWTLSGTMAIAQNTWREFIVTVNADGTGTVQSIGAGVAP